MAQLIVHVQDTNRIPIVNAEVKLTLTQHAVWGNSTETMSHYTSSAGDCYFNLNYLESYGYDYLVQANGYEAISGSGNLGAVTGNYTQGVTMLATTTPANQVPPGQGNAAIITGNLNSFLETLKTDMATAGLYGTIIIVAIAIIAVVILVVYLRVSM